ncbi:MAG: SDR family NAD(P)-dependent oxidoreductase [Halobacteriota archaeon]|uniref:SDR family NAD(P)-dependent oxidoreductase n=1 Tax=Natronomonas sp. TaxID=2184060 RepID=UPI003974A908
MKRLAGKTAVVTGSSTGLGQGIAERFAEEGANVVTNARSTERAAATAEAIRDSGGESIGVGADVTRKADVIELIETAVETYGSIDIMVNNAGTTVEKPLIEQTPAEWRSVIETNLTGTFFGCQVAGEHMLDTDDDCQIINMSSIYGSGGVQGRAPYNASKAGIENLTRNVAVELADGSVQVNALAPGYIRTRLAEAPWGESIEDHPEWPYYEYADEHIENRTPLGRFGTHEAVNNCAAFLAAGEHYMTGEVLTLDGGWIAFGWGSKSR